MQNAIKKMLFLKYCTMYNNTVFSFLNLTRTNSDVHLERNCFVGKSDNSGKNDLQFNNLLTYRDDAGVDASGRASV